MVRSFEPAVTCLGGLRCARSDQSCRPVRTPVQPLAGCRESPCWRLLSLGGDCSTGECGDVRAGDVVEDGPVRLGRGDDADSLNCCNDEPGPAGRVEVGVELAGLDRVVEQRLENPVENVQLLIDLVGCAVVGPGAFAGGGNDEASDCRRCAGRTGGSAVLGTLRLVRSDHAVPAGFLGGVEPFVGLGEHTLDAI